MASFQFYENYWKAMQRLDDADLAKLIRAICSTAFDGVAVELDESGHAFMVYTLMEPSVSKSVQLSKAGAKGGRPKSQKSTHKKGALKGGFKRGVEKQIEVEEEKEKEGEVISNKKRPSFAPPSLQEVAAYIKAEKLNVDASKFFDYYTANGWRVGHVQMNDWKATARNWSRREVNGNGKYRRPDEPAFYAPTPFPG